MTRFLRTAMLLLLVVTPLAAQTSGTTSQVQLRSVSFPVTVLDEQGNPVPGLTASSFNVLEDDKRQTLTGFSAVDFTRQPAAALTPMPPAARRSFVLLFDLGITPGARERAQEAARRFVRDVALPRDLIAVGTVDSEHGFRLLSAFTTDRELTSSAIEDPRGYRGNDPLQIANQTVVFGGALPPETAVAAPGASVIEQPLAQRLGKAIEGVATMASAMRRLEGRKQVILFSEDADGNPAGAEHAVKNCRNADVVLNLVDLGAAKSGAIATVARATGGGVVHAGDDLSAAFSSLLRRQQIVYVLTFDSVATNTAGKFHTLSVRVPNMPKANVIARAGHYEPGNESGFERVADSANIVVNDIPRDDLHMSVLTAPFPTSGPNAQVPVIIDVEGITLGTLVGNGIPIDVFVYAFDMNGIVRDRVFQRLTLDPAKTADTLQRGGVKYVATLALPPGKYAIRSLVAAGDVKGFSRVDTDVRTAKQTALLPPLFLDDAKNWVLVRGASHSNAPYPFVLNGEPFVPSARMTVKNGRKQKLAVFVMNTAPDDLVWQLSVTDAAGKPHVVAPASAEILKGEGVSKVVVDYTPSDLQPGPATASVSMVKRSSNESQRTSAPIVVLQ